MNSLVETKPTAHYADGRIFVSLPHGISLSFPISGNWRLEDATPEQRNDMELDEDGIHWPLIDEDLSYEGLLMGDYGQFVRRPSSGEDTTQKVNKTTNAPTTPEHRKTV